MTDTDTPAPHDCDCHERPAAGPAYDASPLNDLAVISFITSFVFWPVGLLTALVSRREIRRTRSRGYGLSTAALVISAATGLFWTILIVAVLAGPYFPRACVSSSPYLMPARCSIVAPGPVMRTNGGFAGGPSSLYYGQSQSSGSSSTNQYQFGPMMNGSSQPSAPSTSPFSNSPSAPTS